MSNSLWPHRMQQSRLPCSPLSPRVCSNSCPLNQWCHPTISSSVIPFSFCPQSFPALGAFPLSWLFVSGGKSIGASASDFPVSIQSWFPLRLTGLISLLSEESMLSNLHWYIQPIEYGRNNDNITSEIKLWKSLWLLSWSICVCVCVCVCLPNSFFLSHVTCSRKSQLPQHGQYEGQVDLSRNWGHVSEWPWRQIPPAPAKMTIAPVDI